MKTHAIRWKSTVSGILGIGTKLFERQAAESLASELNEHYPVIEHEAVIPVIRAADPPAAPAPAGTITQTTVLARENPANATHKSERGLDVLQYA